MRANRGAYVENAFVDSSPVQYVLWPSIPRAGNNTKHVFHAQRDACPVMRFHFRHRYDEIRSKNSPRKPQVAETGIVGLKLHFDEFIAVEIHECDLATTSCSSDSCSRSNRSGDISHYPI